MTLPRTIELFFVRLPALPNSSHYRLVLRVGSQSVVVLVPLKPRVIRISECDRPLEPIERTLSIAEQGMDSAQPVSAVAVDDLFGTVLEQAGIDLLPSPRDADRNADSRRAESSSES